MKILFVSNSAWLLRQFRLPVILMLQQRGLEVVLVCPESPASIELQDMGFRVVGWGLDRGSTNVVREMLTLLRLIRIYRRESPDAVQHVTVKPNLYGTIAARVVGIPIIINNWDGLGFIFSVSRYARILRSFLLPIMRSVFSTHKLWVNFANNEIAETFLNFSLAESGRVWRFPPVGVDTERFKQPSRRARSVPVVLMASRFLWQKGIREYVHAARELSSRGVQGRFLLCGGRDPDNPSSATEDDLSRWRKEGVIEVMDYQHDMPHILNESDIVVLPSYHEGLGTILLEAAATGLPLVATDIPGCRLAVEHGVNGLLVEPRDTIGLADAIQQLILDEPLRVEFGQASRKKVVERFEWGKVLAAYTQSYIECGLLGQVESER